MPRLTGLGGAQQRHASRRVLQHQARLPHLTQLCTHCDISANTLWSCDTLPPETQHIVGPLVFRRLPRFLRTRRSKSRKMLCTRRSSLHGAPNTELREITRLLKRQSRSRMPHDAICYISDRLVCRQQQPHTSNA